MIKSLFCLLFSLISLIIPYAVLSQNYNIIVTVTGLHNNNGKVILELYNSEDGYPKEPNKAYRTTSQIIANNTCTIVLNNIPKGTYAIACYHDENDNGKLDTNFLGIPNEGVVASNNAKGFMGPPKFKDAKFDVDNNMSLTLKITYR